MDKRKESMRPDPPHIRFIIKAILIEGKDPQYLAVMDTADMRNTLGFLRPSYEKLTWKEVLNVDRAVEEEILGRSYWDRMRQRLLAMYYDKQESEEQDRWQTDSRSLT